MASKNDVLKRKQLIQKILEENNPQKKVDQIIQKTRFALFLAQKESPQAKVDEIVAELAVI